MAKVIIPKTYVKEVQTSLIFLAGPIRGAPNWQDEAIRLKKKYPNHNKTWISKQIAKLSIAQERSAETIRKSIDV